MYEKKLIKSISVAKVRINLCAFKINNPMLFSILCSDTIRLSLTFSLHPVSIEKTGMRKWKYLSSTTQYEETIRNAGFWYFFNLISDHFKDLIILISFCIANHSTILHIAVPCSEFRHQSFKSLNPKFCVRKIVTIFV